MTGVTPNIGLAVVVDSPFFDFGWHLSGRFFGGFFFLVVLIKIAHHLDFPHH